MPRFRKVFLIHHFYKTSEHRSSTESNPAGLKSCFVQYGGTIAH